MNNAFSWVFDGSATIANPGGSWRFILPVDSLKGFTLMSYDSATLNGSVRETGGADTIDHSTHER
jgi:hypothetical protein